MPPLWHALGALGPAVAAFCVTALVVGRPGVRQLLASMGCWRVGIGWLAIATFTPLLLLGGSVVLLLTLGQPMADSGAVASRFTDSDWLLGILVASALYGVFEEPGWRGFALPRLQRRWKALVASCVLAVFWGVWHAPFFAYRYQLSIGGMVGFFLSLLAGSIVLTWLYNSTQGSVLTTTLFHVSLNVAIALGAVLSATLSALISVEVMVIAVVVVLIWKPATLSRRAKYALSDDASDDASSTTFAHAVAHQA